MHVLAPKQTCNSRVTLQWAVWCCRLVCLCAPSGVLVFGPSGRVVRASEHERHLPPPFCAQAEVHGLWLDAWCFRTAGEAYRHSEFCDLLTRVVTHVSLVIWLPHSRPASTSPATYQYRLWVRLARPRTAACTLHVHYMYATSDRSFHYMYTT